MTTNTKPKSAIPNATDQLRERKERALPREVLNEIGAATSRAADVMMCSCLEFTQANAQKSWQTRSLLHNSSKIQRTMHAFILRCCRAN